MAYIVEDMLASLAPLGRSYPRDRLLPLGRPQPVLVTAMLTLLNILLRGILAVILGFGLLGLRGNR